MGYVLGIDGGGTRTTAWLADERRRVRARVEVGPSNPVKVGFPSARRELLRAFHEVCRKPRTRVNKLDAVCAGLAGCDSSEIQEALLSWFRKAVPARAHMLTTDAEIALSAALGERPGLVVIAGTGSIAYGRDAQGRRWRCGGWGSLFDDAGSGYEIGRQAVSSALRALDGRGEATSLADPIRQQFLLAHLRDVAVRPIAPRDLAALFPLVLREAQKGDKVARGLLDRAAAELAELAVTLIGRFDWLRGTPQVVGAGGVFRSSITVHRQFARYVHAQAPHARISILRREPVEGALFLARRLAQPPRGQKI